MTLDVSTAFSPASGFPPLRPVPLESGDHLTGPEFERRYDAMPDDVKKAELIDGVVYMGAAVYVGHGDAHANLMTLLGTFAAMTPNVACSDNVSVRFDLENVVQPDASLRLKTGGACRPAADVNVLEGPPELIAEIASSSASRDMHSKLRLYRRHGVREYLVWRLSEGAIDWFELVEGEYRALAANNDGLFRSRQFPGLWLDLQALLREDGTAALAALNQGLASPEHAALVARIGGQTRG